MKFLQDYMRLLNLLSTVEFDWHTDFDINKNIRRVFLLIKADNQFILSALLNAFSYLSFIIAQLNVVKVYLLIWTEIHVYLKSFFFHFSLVSDLHKCSNDCMCFYVLQICVICGLYFASFCRLNPYLFLPFHLKIRACFFCLVSSLVCLLYFIWSSLCV